jgi:hypothetical protein
MHEGTPLCMQPFRCTSCSAVHNCLKEQGHAGPCGLEP